MIVKGVWDILQKFEGVKHSDFYMKYESLSDEDKKRLQEFYEGMNVYEVICKFWGIQN